MAASANEVTINDFNAAEEIAVTNSRVDGLEARFNNGSWHSLRQLQHLSVLIFLLVRLTELLLKLQLSATKWVSA